MGVRIHCVRHAQGYHNLNHANHKIHDPDLTPLGEQQCATLSTIFPQFFPVTGAPKITHLVASPLRRTLYTCLLSFPAEAQHLTITALPELQETSDEPCDTGSDRAILEAEFGAKADFSLVTPDWNHKELGGKWSPATAALKARARDARLFLRTLAQKVLKSQEDVEIVVVSHGGYLHFFTEEWVGYDDGQGTGWANTEFRSYEFVDLQAEGGDNRAEIRETAESRERRVGKGKSLGKDEQRELRASAEADLSEKGASLGDAKL